MKGIQIPEIGRQIGIRGDKISLVKVNCEPKNTLKKEE